MLVTKHPLYRTWAGMKARCLNAKHHAFPRYGGRGISVCERWANSFVLFLEDMGERPSDKHTLERIDNNRGYEPGNVRWATYKEQAHNTRETRRVTVAGVDYIACELAETIGINTDALFYRINAGFPADKILSKERFWSPVGLTKGRANSLENRRQRTHCSNGHEYTEANTRIENGSRRCLACAAESARKRRAPTLKGRRQSHCAYGHEFTPENTLVYNGHRKCRECGRRHSRENQRKRRMVCA